MNKSNRLINEKSPYLLQHAYNPVDWYPWNDEAFKKAKEEDRPVFLSIGYSTCHWCHVMEKESFEDEHVAKLMNETFVSIKVDREERPDIDGIYMNVCQMLTGSGGWPLTIIMTPDKKPFFAGTYYPKEDRFGRMGMINLIPRISDLWKNKRDEINKSSNEIYSTLQTAFLVKKSDEIDENILDETFRELSKRFDKEKGGFGNAPKFPTPHNLLFLLRYQKRKNSTEALEMVEKTLTEMRKGGIYDHIGLGFHRYSTDRDWLVPHFEKMLYDQALITTAYIEAFQVTGKDIFKHTAEEILLYVTRDMTSTEGGFYSAEDADSEGEEGKFYLWENKEIQNLLNKEEADIITDIFNIKGDGNLPAHEASWAGKNILYLNNDFEEISSKLKTDVNFLKNKIESARDKLFNYREKRNHPFKDTKILTDWNGLMISAFAKAAQVFGKDEYYETAEKAVSFILKNLVDKKGRLLHRYKDGESAFSATADDYAFLVAGLLDLYEVNFNTSYLKSAVDLNSDFIKYFRDEENGGFYFTPSDGEDLLIRLKEIYDGAIPSGNSVAMLNLLRLGRITGNTGYERKASEISHTFSGIVKKSPSAFTQFMAALDFSFGPAKEIIISGSKDAEQLQEIKKAIQEKFIPNKIVVLNPYEGDQIEMIAPYIRDYPNEETTTSVYICENYKCSRPVTEKEELKQLLEDL